jgi:hypothetical protein
VAPVFRETLVEWPAGYQAFAAGGRLPHDFCTPRPRLKRGRLDHSYVAFVKVDEVDGLYTEFVSRGAPVRTPPETKPWRMREFGVQTPDGHRMMFGGAAQ